VTVARLDALGQLPRASSTGVTPLKIARQPRSNLAANLGSMAAV